jgi:metal-sulfur cluster biosynthetic enzyme
MPESETAIPQTHEATVPSEAVPSDTGAPSEDEVLEALKSVIDPELGVNIVDLGLVYEVDVSEGGDVDIQYTLTTMGCPIGPLIEDQMRAFLAPVPGIGDVRPEMVLRPAWTPEMMSDEADVRSEAPDPFVLVPEGHYLRLAERTPEVAEEDDHGGPLLP